MQYIKKERERGGAFFPNDKFFKPKQFKSADGMTTCRIPFIISSFITRFYSLSKENCHIFYKNLRLVLMPFYWVWMGCSLLYVPQFFTRFFFFFPLNLLLSNFLLSLLSFIVVLYSF